MKESKGNLFDQKVNIIVITTNGSIKNDGRAIMGCGCALDASFLWPDLPLILGEKLKSCGNHVFVLKWVEEKNYSIVSFPVKNNWDKKADLKLIEQSSKELVKLVNLHEKHLHKKISVALPKVGCGAGKLEWDSVKKILEKYLDGQFTIIHYEEE